MCGIAGCIAGPGQSPDRAAVERMVAALPHRGPDDQGTAVVGQVAFGHTRLSIVDLSAAGHQPMSTDDGNWWLTYNGEAFNHLELREQLPGVHWRGGSDTETVLHAMERWGLDAPARLNGLYAFAALDVRARRIHLVRDRFGVKPLYIARHRGCLWFASEMRALLAAGIPADCDRDVLRHCIDLGWANGRRTPLDGIERVLPGTAVTVDLDTLATSETRWYDPLETVDSERMRSLAALDVAGAADAVEEALRTSVRRRLMADVPVGTMCSGGIDSSLLTKFAADESGSIHAFNAAIVDQPEYDENRFARHAAESAGVPLHTVETSAATWRRDFVEVAAHVEYPLTHPSSVPMAQIARLARDNGVKVLLSGEGADELFGGYPWVHGQRYWDFLMRRKLWQRPLRRLRSDEPWPPPGPAPEVNEFEDAVARAAGRAYGHHSGPRARFEAGLGTLPALYLPHLLNRQDKTTMQWSVETRVPFLDPDVVSLALNLPLEVKLEPARKAVLKELVRRHLPVIHDRPKVGFGMDAARFIEPLARPEFLRDGMLRDLYERDVGAWAGHLDTLDSSRRLLYWSGEVWARVMLLGHSPETVADDLWDGDPETGQPRAGSSRIARAGAPA